MIAFFSWLGTSAIDDHRAALLAELADQDPFSRVDAQRDLRLVLGKCLKRRQIGVGKRDDQADQQQAATARLARPANGNTK